MTKNDPPRATCSYYGSVYALQKTVRDMLTPESVHTVNIRQVILDNSICLPGIKDKAPNVLPKYHA